MGEHTHTYTFVIMFVLCLLFPVSPYQHRTSDLLLFLLLFLLLKSGFVGFSKADSPSENVAIFQFWRKTK